MGFIHLQIEWNPWLGGYRPHIPILSALCLQLNLLKPPEKIPGVTPPPKKIPGVNPPPPPKKIPWYATGPLQDKMPCSVNWTDSRTLHRVPSDVSGCLVALTCSAVPSLTVGTAEWQPVTKFWFAAILCCQSNQPAQIHKHKIPVIRAAERKGTCIL
jgi:hypothetical protein